MLQILQAFILKLLDNSFGTAKTIFINKEKYMIGAFLNAIGTLFYLIAIVQIAKSDNFLSIIAMCVATFLGTYLPGMLIKKSEKEKLYIFDITSNSFDDGIKFADMVREMNIAIKTNTAYDNNMKKVLCCKIYCTNKEESKTINHFIPKKFKYNILAPLDLND